jgi:hypothetical protein
MTHTLKHLTKSPLRALMALLLLAGLLRGRLMLIRDGYFDTLCRVYHQRAQPEMPGSSPPMESFRPIAKPDGIQFRKADQAGAQVDTRKAAKAHARCVST